MFNAEAFKLSFAPSRRGVEKEILPDLQGDEDA